MAWGCCNLSTGAQTNTQKIRCRFALDERRNRTWFEAQSIWVKRENCDAVRVLPCDNTVIERRNYGRVFQRGLDKIADGYIAPIGKGHECFAADALTRAIRPDDRRDPRLKLEDRARGE